jgi:hypothetical protein
VALFLPATYLATGLQAAMTNMASPKEVTTDVVALGIGLVAAFEVSRQLFRWEPQAKVSSRAKLWALVAMIPFLLFGTYESISGGMLNRVQHNFRDLSSHSSAPPSSSQNAPDSK